MPRRSRKQSPQTGFRSNKISELLGNSLRRSFTSAEVSALAKGLDLTAANKFRKSSLRTGLTAGEVSSYYTGGGGVQATAPSPLMGAALSTTEITNWWIGVGADSYELERSTSSDYSGATQVYSGTAKTFADTGLTADTTYYYRVRSVFGEVKSSWVTLSVKTLIATPLHFYRFDGIAYDTTNAYGKTGAPNTAKQIGEVYSVLGTANTLTPVTTVGSIQEGHISDGHNPKSPTGMINHGGLYATASNISLDGDFCILFETEKNNLLTTFFRVLQNSTDATQYIRMNATTLQMSNAGGAMQITWTNPSTSYSIQRFAFKRVGSTIFVSNNVTETTITWENFAENAETFIFDRIFHAGTAWYSSFLGIYNSDIGDEAILQAFNYLKQPTYTFAQVDEAPVPKGLTFSSLGSDYLIDNAMAYGVSGSSNWDRVITKGDYSFINLTRLYDATYFGEDFIKVYKHSTAEMSQDLNLGVLGTSNNTHNTGSIGFVDNTLYQVECYEHYDAAPPSSLVFKRAGKSFDLAEFTELPRGNGITSFMGSRLQYGQFVNSTNYKCIIAQEAPFSSGNAGFITLLRTRDNWNSYEKIRIASTENVSTEWFYHRVVYREDGVLSVILNQITAGVSGRFKSISYIESTDDGDNWQNIDGSFTKLVNNGGTAVTHTELKANCIVDPDYVTATHSLAMQYCFYDPTDGELYGVASDGTNTGLNLWYTSGGAWIKKAIDFGGRAMVFGFYVDGTNYVENMPLAVRRGPDTYDVYAQELNAGNWIIFEVTTNDKGDTWSDVGAVSNDATKLHARIQASINLHYTGGSTAYNGKKLLIASREQVGYSDLFIKDITT